MACGANLACHQFCKSSFIGSQLHSFIYLLSVAAFALQGQGAYGPQNLNIYYLILKAFAEPHWSKFLPLFTETAAHLNTWPLIAKAWPSQVTFCQVMTCSHVASLRCVSYREYQYGSCFLNQSGSCSLIGVFSSFIINGIIEKAGFVSAICVLFHLVFVSLFLPAFVLIKCLIKCTAWHLRISWPWLRALSPTLMVVNSL